MQIPENYVTVEVFDAKMAQIDRRFESLENKMKEGFEMVFALFERMEQKLDNLFIIKGEKEETLSLHRRVTRLEDKVFHKS